MLGTQSGTRIITELTGNTWKVVYTDGDGNVQELAIGTAGQVLTSNGVDQPPSWENDRNLDGGFANAVYLPSQNVDGGGA